MGKTIKRIIVFALVVVIVQSVAVLALTPSGLERVFPLAVRLSAEKIKPESNTYAAYYNMRTYVSDADVIVVGVDYAVPETYGMLGHFTRFVKQYNNFSDVALMLNNVQLSFAGMMFEQTGEDDYDYYLKKLTDSGIGEEYASYLSELYFVNSTMSPNRKIHLTSCETLKNRPLVEQINELSVVSERSMLCVVDSRELESDSAFRSELTEKLNGKKIVFVQTHYTDSCISADTHTVYQFPFESSSQVYFVSAAKLEGFYSYYAGVTDIFSANDNYDRLDERYTDFFFVVAGGAKNDQT